MMAAWDGDAAVVGGGCRWLVGTLLLPTKEYRKAGGEAGEEVQLGDEGTF